jgi:hypothetical protein
VELYLHSPSTPPWRGAQLKYRDNFTFYLLTSDSGCQNVGFGTGDVDRSGWAVIALVVIRHWLIR